MITTTVYFTYVFNGDDINKVRELENGDNVSAMAMLMFLHGVVGASDMINLLASIDIYVSDDTASVRYLEDISMRIHAALEEV